MFQRNRYIDMIVSAFQSVVATSATATDRMSAILHWFDGAVSDASLPGCSQRTSYVLRMPPLEMRQCAFGTF